MTVSTNFKILCSAQLTFSIQYYSKDVRVLFRIIWLFTALLHCYLLPSICTKPEASGERAVLETEVCSEDNPGEFSVGICIVVTI